MINKVEHYFATCPKGLENLLKQELDDLGSSETRETVAGVYFSGDLLLACKVCLWSRLANRVLLPLAKAPVKNPENLGVLVRSVPWEDYLPEDGSLLVEFLGTNPAIRHTRYGAQAVKDGVVDRIREVRGERPSVNLETPSIRINARLAKNVLHLSLDVSGESLHKRGYRVAQGGAPLKENLAAALLIRAGWPAMAMANHSLLDPMCGSGTLLLEGAMMATDMAPGLLRAETDTGFGCFTWNNFDHSQWQPLVEEAKARLQAGKARFEGEIRGYDVDTRVLTASRRNIEAAGFEELIRISQKDAGSLKKTTHKPLEQGLVICNPPYGERLGEVETLRELYRQLGENSKREFAGWQLAVFTGNRELGRELRLRPKRKYQLFNGTLQSELLLYDLTAEGSLERDSSLERDRDSTNRAAGAREMAAARLPLKERPLSDNAGMLLNRLKKNQKKLGKWLQQTATRCYRLYDADMPEYAAAIDIYQYIDDSIELHLQEYAPPKSIDEDKARHRFDEIVHACAVLFQLDEQQIVCKTRRRNKGSQQYEKLKTGWEENPANFKPVSEGESRLLVNLRDYLDTGLFLDHRPLRLRIANESRGKKFLNLFCYTASATVQAARGGATSSVSVDMSNTYLQWARRNLELNNINLQRHKLVRGNCLEWLNQCREGFDLIMLDPPSFSNSKRMSKELDVQRDHGVLVRRCMDLLTPGGVLYFSNNLRSFKLDEQLSELFNVENISAATLAPDFEGNPKIHHCWKITQR